MSPPHAHQHVHLDDLNLKLCDYELVMDAFAAFRTRQLQTNRTSFLELSGGKDEAAVGTATHRFLEDLHVVSLRLYFSLALMRIEDDFYQTANFRSPTYRNFLEHARTVNFPVCQVYGGRVSDFNLAVTRPIMGLFRYGCGSSH